MLTLLIFLIVFTLKRTVGKVLTDPFSQTLGCPAATYVDAQSHVTLTFIKDRVVKTKLSGRAKLKGHFLKDELEKERD